MPMSRIIRRPVVALLGVVVLAAALVQFGVFAEGNEDVRFSHLLATPMPDCLVESSAEAETATPVAQQETLASMLDVDFRIEAVAANGDPAEMGLPHQLRLYTVRIPIDGPLPVGVGVTECELGSSIVCVVSGEVEFTHHVAPEGAGLDVAGAVSYVASPATEPVMLDPGASPVTLRPGDSIFLEQAIVSYRAVGASDVLLLVSAVSPEWLPCHGGPC